MVRAPFYDKNGLKKGAWSRDEDEKLRSFIQRNGHSNWRLLPKFAGLARCGKSCRLRWMNYLRPNLKHGGYTQEEEEIIIKLHQEVGNKWSRIAEKLPGRSDNEIKNHWHSHLKKSSKRSEMTTSELKSKPCDTSRFTESQSPDADVVADSFHILESSLPVSSDPELTETSCTEENNYSLTSNDTQATASNSRSEEESVAPWVVTFDEFSSDFWTDPFIVEDTYSEEKNSGEDIALSIPYFYEGADLL